MGIEENINRIANSLEAIVVALQGLAGSSEENKNINAWYKSHLAEKEAKRDTLDEGAIVLPDGAVMPKVETVLAEAHVGAPSEPAPAPVAAPAAPEMSYDELKAFLIARGVEIPKGTKMTTLKKLYEKHKDMAPISEPAPAAELASAAPASEVPADPFGLPAAEPAPEQKPAMTKDEAAARIRAHYQATEEDRKAFIEALAAAGVPAGGSFQDVEDGKFDILVETYERIKGIANA